MAQRTSSSRRNNNSTSPSAANPYGSFYSNSNGGGGGGAFGSQFGSMRSNNTMATTGTMQTNGTNGTKNGNTGGGLAGSLYGLDNNASNYNASFNNGAGGGGFSSFMHNPTGGPASGYGSFRSNGAAGGGGGGGFGSFARQDSATSFGMQGSSMNNISSNNLLNGFAVGGGSFYGGNGGDSMYGDMGGGGGSFSGGAPYGGAGGGGPFGGGGGFFGSAIAPPKMATLNAFTGGVRSEELMQQFNEQRRLSRQQQREEEAEEDGVVEGQVAAIGRKNSVSNLSRKDSSLDKDVRTGMYFKNKEATTAEYKKEGDSSVKRKGATVDTTLDNPIRTLLYIERGNPIELDGSTLRLQLPGEEEVTKFDFSQVNNTLNFAPEDLIGLDDSKLQEIKRHFTSGCNSALMMADAGADSSKPSLWFSWQLLKHLMRSVFASKQAKAQITVSAVLLQEDRACDLLVEEDSENFLKMKTLEVGESPMFGKAAMGMTYIGVDTADEFNDTFDEACAVAEHFHATKGAKDGGVGPREYGIMHFMIVSKLVRYSASQDATDVVVNSLFVSGVGDGIVHYNRILDKNPAEPRPLFQFVLYRSILSNFMLLVPADLSTPGKTRGRKAAGEEAVVPYLNLTKRFGAIKTRKPNVRSAIAFKKSAESGIEKLETTVKEASGRRRVMYAKQLDRQRIMLADTKALLDDPQNIIPSVYA
ncbi:hypothetical protein AGDE_13587 [Angomonas deanei]|uniref:Uncharacterized protein n=1 Tax=Angomonas deanei TaxID=59799 RepID=A0A7G2CF50_9TRYP|nr:hypothetical protein AGDE_13587 [Angomonas deanei]CAD2218406.1 hypothetical protein, conserved [Angomonas deanei]|eukprot:EPY22121.1 hypothetical protein AGDE_13587 [Angomonas deanei]